MRGRAPVAYSSERTCSSSAFAPGDLADLERAPQRLARIGGAPRAAQLRAERRERPRALDPLARHLEQLGGLLELRHAVLAEQLAENPQRAAQPGGRAPLARELDLLARELDRLVAASQQGERLGLQRAPGHPRRVAGRLGMALVVLGRRQRALAVARGQVDARRSSGGRSWLRPSGRRPPRAACAIASPAPARSPRLEQRAAEEAVRVGRAACSTFRPYSSASTRFVLSDSSASASSPWESLNAPSQRLMESCEKSEPFRCAYASVSAHSAGVSGWSALASARIAAIQNRPLSASYSDPVLHRSAARARPPARATGPASSARTRSRRRASARPGRPRTGRRAWRRTRWAGVLDVCVEVSRAQLDRDRAPGARRSTPPADRRPPGARTRLPRRDPRRTSGCERARRPRARAGAGRRGGRTPRGGGRWRAGP